MSVTHDLKFQTPDGKQHVADTLSLYLLPQNLIVSKEHIIFAFRCITTYGNNNYQKASIIPA